MKSFLRLLPLALAALPALAGSARADEVVLRNGATFSGVVRESGDKVVIELDFGTMTFAKSDVRSVKKTGDPIKELEDRVQSATDAKGYFEAGMWAREKGLSSRATELFRKALSLNPDHEGARRALGFEKIDGKWLEGDELMMAKGFLKYDGRWLPKDTVEKIQESNKQIQIESDRRETETRIARLQQEVELAKVRLERERLERERLERERWERDREWDSWRWGSWWNGGSWFGTRAVFSIPPPAQANVQPPALVIPGPTTAPARR